MRVKSVAGYRIPTSARGKRKLHDDCAKSFDRMAESNPEFYKAHPEFRRNSIWEKEFRLRGGFSDPTGVADELQAEEEQRKVEEEAQKVEQLRKAAVGKIC